MIQVQSIVRDFIENVLPDGEYEDSEVAEAIFSEECGVEWWSML